MARGVLDFLSVGQGFYPRKSRDHLVSFDNCGRVFGALLKNLLELPKSHTQMVFTLLLPRGIEFDLCQMLMDSAPGAESLNLVRFIACGCFKPGDDPLHIR